MTKFEKIYAVILLAVMVFEMVALVVSLVTKFIYTGEWSYLILWLFVAWLAAVIHMFRFVMKNWEDIR